MVSIRTQYRQKRVELIRQILNLFLDMLLLNKKELETIPLPFFKKLKKTVENRGFEKPKYSRFLTT